ncbi:MAG TPA: RHS repeat domain-containing protein, partial [Thermoanaerobaculia bacterium]|nr:RHS repeat domain-containing protein [Thermoanaerobaculia bacterium]
MSDRKSWRGVSLTALLVLSSLPANGQGSSGSCGDVGGVVFDWLASGQISKDNNCQGGFRCYDVENPSSSVENLNAGCDPTAGVCAVRLHAFATNPGVRDMVIEDGFNPSTPTPKVEWYGCLNAGCSLITTCGLAAFGGQIGFDNLDARAQLGLSCAQAWNTNFSAKIRVCTAGCPKNQTINLPGVSIALGLGCPPPPPPSDCNTCGGCVTAGGGGPAGCGIPVEGGLACGPAKSGPGAHLRYRAGGAGGTGFPGTTAWRTSLGLYWSHEYAQRIVVAPDFTHVWLITERASFREFSNLAAGSGLRLYQTNAPSDEYRRLYYDTATGGWQLDSLDGRKDYFLPDGRWEKTVSQNPTHPTLAAYNGSNQLISVSFPDGRSETFTYHPSGKLASITEVPVSGSGTSPRTWNYVWSGDELTNIG